MLGLPQAAVVSGMRTEINPGSVVGSKHDKSIFLCTDLPYGIKDFPDTPVHFHHGVTKKPLFAFASESLGDRQRDMNHRMGKIEKERPSAAAVYKIDSPLRVKSSQFALLVHVHNIAYNLVAVVERKVGTIPHSFGRSFIECVFITEWPHVVGIWQTKPLVKSSLKRKKLFLVANMPFADNRCSISGTFQYLRDESFVLMNPYTSKWLKSTVYTDPTWITPCHKACTRG